MSHPNRRHLPRPTLGPTESAPAAEPEAPATLHSDSVPAPGRTMRLSGIVKTKTGYATALVELTPEEWETLRFKRLGMSQAFKEHVAIEHKKMVLRLGQKA